jgi:N-acetylglutamate synthase-like GNAT family acetyltransferase
MEISRKLKNEKDSNIILKEISESDGIISLSKKELLFLIEKETIFFGYIDNQLIGLVAFKTINNDWLELSLLLVLKESRNKGYGKQLSDYIFQACKDKKIYVSSRNPITQKWIQEKGFKQIKFFFLPPTIILYLLKNKLKLFKIKDLILKGLKGNWKYYIKT